MNGLPQTSRWAAARKTKAQKVVKADDSEPAAEDEAPEGEERGAGAVPRSKGETAFGELAGAHQVPRDPLEEASPFP